MSRKSTAKASSGGGDAEAIPHGEAYSNILSDSSSGRSKAELGPYGDSPPDQYKSKKDFYILMYHNNGSTESSDGGDREGFDSPDEYMQKLNWVRRRLNLVEIEDQRDACKITEIADENEVDTVKSSEETRCDRHEQQKPNEDNTETGKPFLFNGKSESFKEILDLEYNPPKKMCCYRMRTPKVSETSESSIPYHIRVSLNENLFKHDAKKMSSDEWKVALEKFTDTKEVQCDDQEFNEFNSKSSSSKSQEFEPTNEVKNLYPNVVIKQPTTKRIATVPTIRKLLSKNTISSPQPLQEINVVTDDYVRTLYSSREYNLNRSQVVRNVSLNYVEDSLDDNNAMSSTTTIIASPKTARRDRHSKKQNVWNQINEQVDQRDGECPRRKMKKQRKHLDQYVTYRKENNRAQSSPIRTNQVQVAYGPVILDHSDLYNLDNNFYVFSSSSDRQSSCADEQKGPFWRRLFCCFR